jgi:cytochrome c oxidase subunit 2
MNPRPMRAAVRVVPAVLIAASAAFGLVACGDPEANRTTTTLGFDAQAGKAFAATNCLGCHAVEAKKTSSGPSWVHLAGSTVHLQGGGTVTADDTYLTEAIQDPDVKIVDGYSSGMMSSAFPPGSISRDQVRQLVAYIDSLK